MGNNANQVIEKFSRMRAAGVPIIVATTPDPADFVSGTIRGMRQQLIENEGTWSKERVDREKDVALYGWDAVRGVFVYNDAARSRIASFGDNPSALSGKPDIMLKRAANMSANSIVFAEIKQEHLHDPIVRQGIANLRDDFKVDRRTLVIIGQSLQLPFELTGDVLFIDEELPTREVIRATIDKTLAGVDVVFPDEQIDESVEALCGLTQFQVEQLTAINVRKSGILVDELWNAKKRVIGQTPGLTIFEGDEDFSDLVGLENIKTFMSRLLHGKNKPNAIVFIDELEKSINTNTNDTSGVSLDQLQNVLTEMTDTDAAGMLLFGIPGVGKSAIAKAAGREARIPTLKLDFGAAKGSLVGQSEAQFRTALKKIRAISSKRTLWIATCNSVAGLPSELRSRFSYGSFFFDLPSGEQLKALWRMYTGKYNLPSESLPHTKNWTGREVRNCCRLAHDMKIGLRDAATYIVPIIDSAKDRVDAMRQEANGRFLDADREGMFTITQSAAKPKRREIAVEA